MQNAYDYFPSVVYPVDGLKTFGIVLDLEEDINFSVPNESIALLIRGAVTVKSKTATDTIINYSNLTITNFNYEYSIANYMGYAAINNYGNFERSITAEVTSDADYAIKNYGTMDILGGSIVGSKTLFYNQGDLTIYCDFNDTATADAIVHNANGGKVTITDGDYSTIPNILAEGSDPNGVTIKGGTYAEDPTPYLLDGFGAICQTVNGVDMWTVVTLETIAKAKEAIAEIKAIDFSSYPTKYADKFTNLVEYYETYISTATSVDSVESCLSSFYDNKDDIMKEYNQLKIIDEIFANYKEEDYEPDDYARLKQIYENAKQGYISFEFYEDMLNEIPKKEPKKTIEATTIDNSSANAEIIKEELLGFITKDEFEGVESVKVELSVSDIEDLIPTESEALEILADNSDNDYTLAYAWDIDLTKYVGDNATALTDLNGREITITIDVPQDMIGKDILEDTDQDSSTYTFRSDLFSTYALVEVTEKSESTTEPTPEPNEPIIGDVDEDRLITSLDASLLARYLTSNEEGIITEQGMISADVTHDGKLTMEDLVKLKKYLIDSTINLSE